MSEKSSASAAEAAASTGFAGVGNNASSAPNAAAGAKKAAPEGNPAFRMMGAVVYDKWQTRRVCQKWCDLVSHITDEHLDSHQLPRRMTIYLTAPPADGLRTTREHFHTYVKPVLVAAAMDWDVVEGRKEGDVRHKTAERIRKKRRKAGEGQPEEEESAAAAIEAMRKNLGTREYEGIGGDLIIGRNTWKEYIRGLHEGWLGPVDAPITAEPEMSSESIPQASAPGQTSLGDAAVDAAGKIANEAAACTEIEGPPQIESPDDASPTAEQPKEEEKEKEEEKPKRRQPLPYILPSEYESATVSSSLPDSIGPSIGIRLPHLLGIRNTPIRIYRFLNRRHLADSIGRDVAAAILASNRPYNTLASNDSSDESGSNSEVEKVLEFEERDWWKTTYQPRKEHEESVWIEDMAMDERIVSRMRAFELTAEDEDRAKRIGQGKEVVAKNKDEENA